MCDDRAKLFYQATSYSYNGLNPSDADIMTYIISIMNGI